MGEWVLGREKWEIKEEKGRRGRDKNYLVSSSPPLFLLCLQVIPFFNGGDFDSFSTKKLSKCKGKRLLLVVYARV
jgi:hypothetical protein